MDMELLLSGVVLASSTCESAILVLLVLVLGSALSASTALRCSIIGGREV